MSDLSTARAARFMPWVVTAVAGPPACSALVIASFWPDDAPWALASVLCGIWLLLFLVARGGRQWRVRVVLVALPLVAITWPEMALRWASFRHDHGMSLQFGFPPPQWMVQLQRDPELFWELRPGQLIEAGKPPANSIGFVGPEFELPKPEDTYRIVVFGDSCTMQGYPALIPEAMAPVPGRAYDAINLGIAGYSSHQGVVLATRWARRLEPDVAVIFFGWNDHWRTYGAPDSEKTPPAWQRVLQEVLQSSRTWQWISSWTDWTALLDEPRVSSSEYADNLEAMGGLVEGAGGRVLLLTAPTSMYELGAPDYLIPEFAVTKSSVLELHREYNDVVRDVAQRRGWRLLDLEQEIPVDRLAELIAADRIHFTPAGLAWVAERIARAVEAFAK